MVKTLWKFSSQDLKKIWKAEDLGDSGPTRFIQMATIGCLNLKVSNLFQNLNTEKQCFESTKCKFQVQKG